MTAAARRAAARACLPSEASRTVFDQLLTLYPDASVFWECGEMKDEVELGVGPTIEYPNGVKVASVYLTIVSMPEATRQSQSG